MGIAFGSNVHARDSGSRDETEKFLDEEAAYEFVEQQVWPLGPVCPHCGKSARIGKLTGASTRINTYKCYHCRKPFTVKIGTIFEGSHVPMHKWLRAILLVRRTRHLNASQASSALGVSFKTAVAMITRIGTHPQRGARAENHPVPVFHARSIGDLRPIATKPSHSRPIYGHLER